MSGMSPVRKAYYGDPWLLVCVLLLLCMGLVMMTSASIEIAHSQHNDVFYHLKRQLRFVALGLVLVAVVMFSPVVLWQRFAVPLYLLALGILTAVLIPGVGHEVNGSMRWINLGIMNVQASEPAKFLLVVAVAAWLSRYQEYFRTTWTGFFMPAILLVLPMFLLLKEPDFGAVVVLMIALLGMMFLAGASLFRFGVLSAAVAGGAVVLVMTAEYRMARIRSFMQALADPFSEDVVYGSGYQLAQALIAFGRGEWLGAGLGNSIQKIYFLPEAHTDFVFAIVAEELGMVALFLLLLLFAAFILRAMRIARRNEEKGHFFPAYVAYGVSLLFAGQVLINIAVNVGLLPTKGLTLPFFSYGGSSLIICLVMVAMLLRIDMENERTPRRVRRGGPR